MEMFAKMFSCVDIGRIIPLHTFLLQDQGSASNIRKMFFEEMWRYCVTIILK